MKKVVLVWFRNDLRLHDNEVLLEAIQKADVVIPVYCFDPRYFRTNKYGNKNTGVLRAQFITENVQALKDRLKALGSDLMTFLGLPEDILPRLASKYEVSEVYHHREVAHRETTISEKVEAALWQTNQINLKHFIGHTMYHKEDLPFPVKDIPDSFSIFKKKVERESSVREALKEPHAITSPAHLEDTTIPTLAELGFLENEIASIDTKKLIGGEENGLRYLEQLAQADYQGFHDFTLISPYISIGALSPMYVYHRLKNSDSVKNKKTHDFRISCLLWRDYYRFMLKKYPNVYFKGHKKQAIARDESNRSQRIEDWKSADTGNTFIDTAIAILKNTGNLPYQLRYIIGLYLIQETSASWLEGASFFEEHLLDYTPSTTYGLWSHIAGVGTSPKDNLSLSWQEAIAKYYPKGLEYGDSTVLNI